MDGDRALSPFASDNPSQRPKWRRFLVVVVLGLGLAVLAVQRDVAGPANYPPRFAPNSMPQQHEADLFGSCAL